MSDCGPQRLPAPCVIACPAGIDVPRYIGYVERGQFAEANAVVRESIPLPTVCGLICYRPCEPWCRRGILEAPVAINALKRAAREHAGTTAWPQPHTAAVGPTGKRVAVVGSGPAGLTATYYLSRRRGHDVTLFEAMPELGGQLRTGIPEYRVPRDRLRQEIDLVTQTRVHVKTGRRINDLDALRREFDAVLLAIGQGRPRSLGIEGEALPGVAPASEFLREANLGRIEHMRGRVAVLGGDNVAVDSARVALRLGSEAVTILLAGPMSAAAAHDFELQAAREEGVKLEEHARPVRIEEAGGSLRVMILREGGAARGEPAAGADAAGLDADAVLVSAGQGADVPPGWGLALGPKGTIRVTPSTVATSRDGVFAVGDAVNGPDSIVGAMAHGKRAAEEIDRYLGGDGDLAEEVAPPPGAENAMPPHLAQRGKRPVPMSQADPARRRTTFNLVELGYSREEAVAEARRCIRCDLWRNGVPDIWRPGDGP